MSGPEPLTEAWRHAAAALLAGSDEVADAVRALPDRSIELLVAVPGDAPPDTAAGDLPSGTSDPADTVASPPRGWRLTVHAGALSVEEPRDHPVPSLRLVCAPDVAARITTGEDAPSSAVLHDRLRMQGDPLVAVELRPLLNAVAAALAPLRAERDA
ncbi:MAG: SCP2 sterol-binding domain-containing protein [Microthrixaceae bacterium]